MVPELLQVVIVGLMLLIPVFFIYRQAGLNPLWSLLVFVPGFGLLLIMLDLAFRPWPKARKLEHKL